MAEVKITDLTALTATASGDLLYIVDVSDTTDSAAGTSKKITLTNFGTNLSLITPLIKDYTLVGNILGNVSGATTIDVSLGNYVTATCTADTTWTFSNPPASGTAVGFILVLTNGGAYIQTWPNPNVKWPGGSAPTLTASGTDVLVFLTSDGGTTWRGVASMLDSK